MEESAGLLTSIISRAGCASAFGAKVLVGPFHKRLGDQNGVQSIGETDDISFILLYPAISAHHDVHLDQTH